METSPWVERVQLAFKRVGTVSTLLSTVVVKSEETFFMYVCISTPSTCITLRLQQTWTLTQTNRQSDRHMFGDDGVSVMLPTLDLES